MNNWQEVTAQYVLELLDNGIIEGNQIIDVREAFEWDFYHLEPSVLIPMNTIPERLGEIDGDKPLYIVCAHGVRSAAVCSYLEEQGYSGLHNVAGGMAAIASLKGFQYD
ncbi:rhodanese-like domain-containing protein [Paenibacillus luteus]|uniref:rhodanese-like domain-containing protein n=1 Tax=Paenibacillus luteus TaxID=2545753 RepID=UPI001143DD89|nr:rhodanese-like domain-containing protein [Paenibacillus luteus]